MRITHISLGYVMIKFLFVLFFSGSFIFNDTYAADNENLEESPPSPSFFLSGKKKERSSFVLYPSYLDTEEQEVPDVFQRPLERSLVSRSFSEPCYSTVPIKRRPTSKAGGHVNIYRDDATDDLPHKERKGFVPIASSELEESFVQFLFKRSLEKINVRAKEAFASQPTPFISCFFCYAHPEDDDPDIKDKLSKIYDAFSLAGLKPLMDVRDSLIGSTIGDFAQKIDSTNFVLFFGSKRLVKKYTLGLRAPIKPAICREIARLKKRVKTHPDSILAALLDGDSCKDSFPSLHPPSMLEDEDITSGFEDPVFYDFKGEKWYQSTLMTIGRIYELYINSRPGGPSIPISFMDLCLEFDQSLKDKSLYPIAKKVAYLDALKKDQASQLRAEEMMENIRVEYGGQIGCRPAKDLSNTARKKFLETLLAQSTDATNAEKMQNLQYLGFAYERGIGTNVNMGLAWKKYMEAYKLKKETGEKCPYLSFVLSRFAIIHVCGMTLPDLEIPQDIEKAYECATESIKTSTKDNDLDLLHNLAGQISVIRGEHTSAQKHFERTQNPISMYYLARILFHQSEKNIPKCIELCQAAHAKLVTLEAQYKKEGPKKSYTKLMLKKTTNFIMHIESAKRISLDDGLSTVTYSEDTLLPLTPTTEGTLKLSDYAFGSQVMQYESDT